MKQNNAWNNCKEKEMMSAVQKITLLVFSTLFTIVYLIIKGNSFSRNICTIKSLKSCSFHLAHFYICFFRKQGNVVIRHIQ